MKKIEFYVTENQKCPYLEWLGTLSLEYQARIDMRLKRLQAGNFGDHKKLQNSELSELRFSFGAGYRIYYKEIDNVVILLLAGSNKSDQDKMIKQAGIYLNEYMQRSINND